MTSPEPASGAVGAEPFPRAVLARRVRAFLDASDNRMATVRHRLPFGVGRFCPELPHVYAANHVQIDRPVALAELRPVLAELFDGLDNTKLFTDWAEVAWSLGPALAEDGFSTSQLVYMVHDPAATPTVSPLGFGLVDAAAYQTFDAQRIREEAWYSPEVAREMERRTRMLQERLGARFVMAADGRAGCHLYRFGTTAQIEEVGVLSEHRGQGLGLGLMAAALADARSGDQPAETVLLIAGAGDWPRRWYRRLGFREVASGWEWDRKVDA